ncbi:MAG: four helix bundle protein [Cytophagales bacterium]|jgi:four helix bundle protein|nr:four helix bundle protein [Cytophagales bacterium]MCA6388291.1 four helix bundle protein [Cytophagales bacterium]MCA6392366.1 four helix bundle protein [Cytophagales bacterium]MCA6398535.1 four helix bundle protein [Cytophagales bacterium]MCA6400814.1 four helix bundle protein [Cytophagales bacterium]
MDKIQLQKRTKEFAKRVFKLTDRLSYSQASKVITYQLLKSASSVAANYRAVNRAKSDDDFTNKLKIVLEEADESNFWLTFISDIELLKQDDDELLFLIKESDEFIAIFTAATKTMSLKKPQPKSQSRKS